MLTLQYKALETLVREMHRIPEDKSPQLLGRFKYFQRMPFPDVAKRGKGNRPGYEFPEVLQLLVAFNLLDAGATPLLAASMVKWSVSVMEASIIRAWLSVLGEIPADSVELLLFEVGGLSLLGDEVRFNEPFGPCLFPYARSRARDWTTIPDGAQSMVLSVLDPIKIVVRLRMFLRPEDLDTSFDELGRNHFGNSNRSIWGERAF